MRINGLEIGGFGVWTNLKLEGLNHGINVLYGPNEAGKTTLLQFVRSVLYGFSPERRQYLPPLRGGRPGGTIDLGGPNGRFCLERYYDEESDSPNREQITLTAADGTRQGEHLVKVLLANVDEVTFNNVFAVGLREIQELGTLGDTEAAEQLYNLTAGLDRVSLVEVIDELATSRNRILDPRGNSCQVVKLLADREKLRGEIEELGGLTRCYARLLADRNLLEREIIRLEEENTAAENQAKVVELAIALGERWAGRAELDNQLAAMGRVPVVPEGAVEQLDAVGTRAQKHRDRLEQLEQQYEGLKEEAAELKINESLWRQAARIEALGEQESWIASLQEQVGRLETEIGDLENGLAAEYEQLGLRDQIQSDTTPSIPSHTLAMLRRAAKGIRRHREEAGKAKADIDAANETIELLGGEIESAVADRNHRDLPTAIDHAGNTVSQLRRRVQIDERLDEMADYQRDLEGQGRHLVDRQLLPVWVLIGFGAVFALGAVLTLAGFFLSTGPVGWTMAVIGLLGLAAAAVSKLLLERANKRQLDAVRRQLDMLQMQIRTTKDERDVLDGQLAQGTGPIADRLAAAERDVAALEALLPVETRRAAVRGEAEAAARRLDRAEQDLKAARYRWREALLDAGLPGDLTPKQVKRIVQRCDQIAEMNRRVQERREELAGRRRELDSVLGRIGRVIEDAGIAITGDRPSDQLRQLAEAVREQEVRSERRGVLRREARQVRRLRSKHEEAVAKFNHLRREVLHESGAEDEQQLRQRAVEAARAEVLRRERDAISREIAAAIGGSCPEEAIGEQLKDAAPCDLETRWEKMLERAETLGRQLQDRFEKRGQLNEQLKTLAGDRQMAEKQLELASLEKQLEDAVRRWQVLALTGRTLEVIRTTYEQERQPETLQEASGYLDRLTRGRYRRVWTPLGEDVLNVDDAEGNALAVEMLSRGTREQLFLSLRLALAASYARHGAPLPLILDDVLVNFDAARAKAAAGVLRDFAAAGHQLLVFTCHEHILKLFKSLKVSVNQLPDNAEANHATIAFDPTSTKKKTTKKKTTAKNRKSKKSKPPVVDEPEEEPIVANEPEQEPVAEEAVEEAGDAIEPADDDGPWMEVDDDDLDDDELEDELEDEEYDEDDEEDGDEDFEEEDYDEEEYDEEDYEEDDAVEAA